MEQPSTSSPLHWVALSAYEVGLIGDRAEAYCALVTEELILWLDAQRRSKANSL